MTYSSDSYPSHPPERDVAAAPTPPCPDLPIPSADWAAARMLWPSQPLGNLMIRLPADYEPYPADAVPRPAAAALDRPLGLWHAEPTADGPTRRGTRQLALFVAARPGYPTVRFSAPRRLIAEQACRLALAGGQELHVVRFEVTHSRFGDNYHVSAYCAVGPGLCVQLLGHASDARGQSELLAVTSTLLDAGDPPA